MNKSTFLREVETRLSRLFSASRAGQKIAPVDRHRLEGFMQAGVFLGLVNRSELSGLMENTHLRIFGQTIAERRATDAMSWSDERIDYSGYDSPSYTRSRD